MKGSPLRELCLVVIAGLLLLIPLWLLTRGTQTGLLPVAESDPLQSRVPADAWLDARFSHPPERVEILQEGRQLWLGENTVREDGDLVVEMERGYARLDMVLVWPESVSQAYAEFTLELEGQPAQSIGMWGQGTLRRSWTLQETSAP